MTIITDAQAVQFANDRCRRIANAIEILNRTIPQFLLDVVIFETQTSGNDNGDFIDDGATVSDNHPNADGRKPVTKGNALQLKYVIEQLSAALNADDRAALVHNWVTETQPLY